MILGISGGRNRRISEAGFSAMDNIFNRYSITTFISGHCPTPFNIDKDGEEWARKKGIKVQLFKPRWDLYDKKAGPIRNREMADLLRDNNGLLLLFPGDSGTLNMKQECLKRLVPLIDLTEEKYSIYVPKTID